MLDVIAVFDKRLKKKDVKLIIDYTSAQSVSAVDTDFSALFGFYNIVLGRPSFHDVSSFRIQNYSGLSALILSDLRPIMIFQGGEGVLETIEKYGILAIDAQHLLRVHRVMCGTTVNVIKAQMELGVRANAKIAKWLSGNISSILDLEFEEIIRCGRDYYSGVSQVEV